MPTPSKSLDDMPLAAYGGPGVDDAGRATSDGDAPAEPSTDSRAPAAGALPAGVPAGKPAKTKQSNASALATVAAAAPQSAPASADDLPVPEDEPSHGPTPLERVVHVFRTSRVAAGAGF